LLNVKLVVHHVTGRLYKVNVCRQYLMGTCQGIMHVHNNIIIPKLCFVMLRTVFKLSLSSFFFLKLDSHLPFHHMNIHSQFSDPFHYSFLHYHGNQVLMRYVAVLPTGCVCVTCWRLNSSVHFSS
jgi:hypothetical protein